MSDLPQSAADSPPSGTPEVPEIPEAPEAPEVPGFSEQPSLSDQSGFGGVGAPIPESEAALPPSTYPGNNPPLQTSSAHPFLISGPLTLGEILDRAFRLYRKHVGVLLLTAAIFLVPLGLFSGWVTGNFMVGYLDFIFNMEETFEPSSPDPDFEEIMSMLSPFANLAGLYVLLLISGLFAQSMVSLALIAHSLAILRGQALTVGESIRVAFGRLWAFIGKAIVQWLIIAAVTFALMLMIALIGLAIAFAIGGVALFDSGFGASEPSPIAIFGLVITFVCGYIFAIMLFFAPTIYFSARYIASTVGLLDQNWGVVESLRQSWRLTEGRTWRCIGYSVLLFLLTLLIVNVPIGVVQQIVGIFSGGDFETLALTTGIFAGVTALMTVLWQPFYMAANVLFYMDLRVRQENYDLELRLQQLESSQT